MFTRRLPSQGLVTGIDLQERLGDRTPHALDRTGADPRWLRHRLSHHGEVRLRDRLARAGLAPAR